ncbi:hypothetical protein PIB30_064492 [Stylosanthes scabra]|uniref:Protein BIG GRAIN 1-like B n=1 Tax=Stylosanthes scabra TaxID=79078 RepID=A0ABU6TLI9_9FABA|nr:hypothetical protein [Stylosanthes scabra]
MYIMEKESLTYPQRKRTPSFSSTLLDAIYRSIDGSKSDLDNHQQLGHHSNEEKSNRTTMKHNNHGGVGGSDGGGGNNKNKSKSKKEKLMMNNHLCRRRHSVMLDDECSQIFTNSVTSTLSECSSYGSVGVGATFSPSSKREISSRHILDQKKQQQQKKKKAKRDGGDNSKLRALKMYGKLKQPISPGSRIASFLCSIFNSGSVKKAKKMCYVGAVDDVNLVTFQHKSKSPCFSSSSSTMAATSSSLSRRSCMSKTSSSSTARNDNNNGVKRSVRFYPVSVILGENDNDDSQQRRYSAYSEKDPSLLPLRSVRKISRSSTSCIEAARENYSSGKGNNGKFEYIRGYYGNCEDEDDEDDALSYSSSDLFELDHIIIGGAEGRYQEELPVYETTNLETNKAIANGLCL